MARKRTILLFGRTNAGKTVQLAELAGYIKKTTGKITRIYNSDRGGLNAVQNYVDLGIIEVVELGNSDPWLWLNKAVRGMVRDSNGKWIAGKNDSIGMFAFESLTSIADELMLDMAKKAATGVNIGGGANVAFTASGDGETLKISGNNIAHFGVCQSRIKEELWESQKLNAPFILWTAGASKDEDPEATGRVVGPAVVGKSMTAELPRYMNYTIRMDCLPAQNGKPERHLLYLGSHTDINAGNATGLGNIRMPLDAPTIQQTIIEPASLVKAIQLIEGGENAALEALKKRLSL